jgi:RNA polymerase sigma factor (sigma-70 family)
MNETERAEWVRVAVDRYSGPLTRYAAVILDDADRARDVVQDAFLRLWHAEPARVEARLAEWLFTVCRNRALDILRKEKRMQPLEELEGPEPMGTTPDPAQAADLRETHGRALWHLARLPKGQQEVLRLKFQNDMSYEEIARITSRTVNNVGVLMHVGLKTLREAMLAEAGEERRLL